MKEELVMPGVWNKPLTKQDLIKLYKVSWKIIKTWMEPYQEEIGPRTGHFYTPRQVKIIFEKVGVPERLR